MDKTTLYASSIENLGCRRHSDFGCVHLSESPKTLQTSYQKSVNMDVDRHSQASSQHACQVETHKIKVMKSV